MKLEAINDTNFSEFLGDEGLVFLFIGKGDCNPCATWTEELLGGKEVDGLSRAGKVTLGSGGLTNLKRVHGPWLSTVRELPWNSLWRDGVLLKEWPGSGLDRLVARVEGLVGRG